jgi:hypothetical protein
MNASSAAAITNQMLVVLEFMKWEHPTPNIQHPTPNEAAHQHKLDVGS